MYFNTGFSREYLDFLVFEREIFADLPRVAACDPMFHRYGEYRFALEMLAFQPNEIVVDVGCSANLLAFYLAHRLTIVHGIDIEAKVRDWFEAVKSWSCLKSKKNLRVELLTQDFTRSTLPDHFADKAVAVSSIEHMFSDDGEGDRQAVLQILRILKPGGEAVITVPSSGEGGFHEARSGDSRDGQPYRLYDREAIRDRLLSDSKIGGVTIKFLAHTTPDPRFTHLTFQKFWLNKLGSEDRKQWSWAYPILGEVFNPIISEDEAMERLGTVNTVLIHIKKKC